jgi:two-component system nitrate/nitrite response regulator NarL
MRLVICDDHKLLLLALATALAGRGFTIEATAESPSEAVRAVALNDPDILLTDLSFPAGSGLDAAREVMAHHPRTKVVMLTGSEQPEPLLEALSIGVAGYLAKDRPIDALARSLAEVARGGTAIDKDLLRTAPRSRVSAPHQRRSLDSLTATESRVMDLMAEGLCTSDIVRRLGVTQSPVRTHVQNIFTKLGVHTRLQAVALLSNGAAGDRDAVRC